MLQTILFETAPLTKEIQEQPTTEPSKKQKSKGIDHWNDILKQPDEVIFVIKRLDEILTKSTRPEAKKRTSMKMLKAATKKRIFYESHHLSCATKHQECPICISTCEYNLKTKCGHVFCHDCIEEHIKTKTTKKQTPECPLCRQIL
jgi:hypothetical protein